MEKLLGAKPWGCLLSVKTLSVLIPIPIDAFVLFDNIVIFI